MLTFKDKGWFSLVHKHNISITSENTLDISISKKIRRTNPLICLMLFSLAHKHKHKTNIWVRSSAYAYVTGVLTCLCLCYALFSMLVLSAYALVKTSVATTTVQCCNKYNGCVSVRCNCLFISLLFSTKQQGEIAKFCIFAKT